LTVKNEKSLLVDGYNAAITHNRTSLSQPGDWLDFTWDMPGMSTGPNMSYTTEIGGSIANGSQPAFVAFINQLNVTYAPLNMTSDNCGYAYQPGGTVFEQTPYDGIIVSRNIPLTLLALLHIFGPILTITERYDVCRPYGYGPLRYPLQLVALERPHLCLWFVPSELEKGSGERERRIGECSGQRELFYNTATDIQSPTSIVYADVADVTSFDARLRFKRVERR
jgi:hypothetical protein